MALADPARVDILVMTATITPADSPELARTDPAVRLADYAGALSFYIDQLRPVPGAGPDRSGQPAAAGRRGGAIDAIVFAENSDSDVATLVALARARGVADRVEFIANYGRHSCPGRDRSVGESRLLDHAMATSRLIAAAVAAAGGGADTVVWKVTGRYRVVNLARMVDTAPARFDLYCDLRNRPIEWADLRFMAWTPAGYDRLLRGIAERLGTDPREPAMYAYLAGLADPLVVRRYRVEPLVDGVRGWDNRHYARGGARVKFWLRSAARRLLPGLWI